MRHTHIQKPYVVADLHIVGSSYNPVLPGNKYSSSHWEITNFKRFDKLLGLIVPYMHIPVVQGDQHPLLSGVEVTGLYTVRPSGQFPLNVKL